MRLLLLLQLGVLLLVEVLLLLSLLLMLLISVGISSLGPTLIVYFQSVGFITLLAMDIDETQGSDWESTYPAEG